MSPNETVKRKEFEKFKDTTMDKINNILLKLTGVVGRVDAIETDLPALKTVLTILAKIEERIELLKEGRMTRKEIIFAAIALGTTTITIIFAILTFINNPTK